MYHAQPQRDCPDKIYQSPRGLALKIFMTAYIVDGPDSEKADKDETVEEESSVIKEAESYSYSKNPMELLLGREMEWQTLTEVSRQSLAQRQILYLWGPPGSGKSYLLQRFFDTLADRPGDVVFTEAQDGDLSYGDLAARSSTQVGQMKRQESRAQRFVHAVDAVEDKSQLVWIIDDYDAWHSQQAWLWPTIATLRRAGACIILTGRESPRRLWPGEQSTPIVSRRLNDFDAETATQLCRDLNVQDPHVINEAIAISRGRPRLLRTMVDGFKLLTEEWPAEDDLALERLRSGMASFLLEQVCHPGSRRISWRAGQGSDKDVDALVAAAAMTPMFNRQLLTEVVGSAAVMSLWDMLASLPFLDAYQGGFFSMPVALRTRIRQAAQQARPWMWEQWTRKMASFYLHDALHKKTTQTDIFWDRILPFIRTKIGCPVFAEDEWLAENFTLTWGRLSELPGLTYDAANIPSAQAEALTAFHPDGTTAGYAVVDRSRDNMLVIHDIVEMSDEPLVAPMLFSVLMRHFPAHGKVLWVSKRPSATAERMTLILDHMGFGLPIYKENAAPSRMLDLETAGYHAWLAHILRAPQAPAPEKPVPVVQEALQVLSSEPQLEETTLAAYWQKIGGKGSVLAWLLDALTSADLGAAIGGKTLLALYYLDKQGTHEELAERLHVSRATYFRNHRTALDRLAQALFG